LQNFESVQTGVEVHLGEARLHPYRILAQGDVCRALAMYRWNSQVSSSLFEVLAVVEIALRTALDVAIQAHLSPAHDWLLTPDHSGIRLNTMTQTKIGAATRRVQARGLQPTHDLVLSQLNFGFWTYLLARNYEPVLWTPALRHAFPRLTPANRAVVFQSVLRLRKLRNLIAHHESIYARNLSQDLQEALTLLSWVSQDLSDWVQEDERVSQLLASRP
jgi:hypothetical protein